MARQSIFKPVSFLTIVFDTASVIILFVIWLILRYFVKPIRRPFLCSDLDLYHPEPIKNVFPTWLLFVCAVAIPIVIILLSEGVRWCYLHRKRRARVVYQIQIRSTIYNVPEWLRDIYILIGVFFFCNCVTAFLTNIGKVTVGRLRPHFIPTCFNKYSYHDFCVDATQWIVNYTCIGETSTVVIEKDGVYDIRQSFPSGHASTAFCGLIFLALYIHRTWNHRNNSLLPYVVETGCFGLAAYIAISRVTDHRHHPTDVLAGSILGTVIAIIAFRYVIRLFKQTVPVDPSNTIIREGPDPDFAS